MSTRGVSGPSGRPFAADAAEPIAGGAAGGEPPARGASVALRRDPGTIDGVVVGPPLDAAALPQAAEPALDERESPLEKMVRGLGGVANSAELRAVAERLLGPSSFGIGVLVGMAKNPIDDVMGLVELQKTFVLADLYEKMTEGPSWQQALKTVLKGPGAALELGAAALVTVGAIDLQDLRAAYEQREAMKRELKEILSHPLDYLGELPGKLRDEYVEKWNRFVELNKKGDLGSQFEAGKILGDLIMDVASTVAGAATGVGAAAKLATKAPKLVKLARMLGKADAPGPDGLARPGGKPDGPARTADANGPKRTSGDDLARAAATDRKKITELAAAGKLDEARALLRPHLDAAKAATTAADKRAAMDAIVDRLDFTSAKDKMFWSGNKDLAAKIAEGRGATVLEKTPGGRVIDNWDDLNRVFDWKGGIEPRGAEFWGKVSRNYAREARGSVEIVQSADRFPQGGATWRDHEWPEVRARALRGEVTELVIHRIDDKGRILETRRLDPLAPETNALFGKQP